MSCESAGDGDWTQALPQTDHVRFFKSVDWAKTALGPLPGWSTALRMYTHMVMSDSRAATLYWGPTQIAVYNAAFVPLAAGAHPLLMGQPFAFGFPELDPFIRPLFEEGFRSGQAQDVIEAPMMVDRNGYREEAFFTGNFTPIRGVDGELQGFYNALFEVTAQKISQRRQVMLNLLATPDIVSVDAVHSHIMSSLATDPHDIPMAILHEADTETEPGKTILRLRGQLGIPQGHALLQDNQDLQAPDGIMPLCRQAVSGRIVTKFDHRFDGIEWLGFNQQPKEIVTMALSTRVRLFGFLTIGTNPYRPFDESCVQFTNELTRTASSVLAAASDAEYLRKEQQQLQSELQFSDMKVRHLVEHASVGMAHAKPDGKLLWANDEFFSLASSSPVKNDVIDSIYAPFLDDDQQRVRETWIRVFSGENHVSAEFRLKRLFNPPTGEPEPVQIQILAFPFKENGVAVSGMACITDISRLKWSESFQARIARDAREAKRQQEAFIDVVSHELRNPLSAIVHCADAIYLSLEDVIPKKATSEIPDAVIQAFRTNASAASTILDCCKHQKRIIDDVLTLSRLDATLLSVNPTAVRPADMISSVMSMFDAEIRSKSITSEVIAESSISDLQIDYLDLDGSRVVQILINLLTNAIKFMNTEMERKLTVRYGASLSPPGSTGSADLFPEVHWAPKGKNACDVLDNTDWAADSLIYLTFTLTDTGIGMRRDEIDKIFERFRQANFKTHVTYGGSGLGLHISKELTERMAGEMGVMSSPGKGSMFVFYIKTRRATKDASIRNSSTSPQPPLISALSLTETAKLRTLLVEDNIVNQNILQAQLKRHGCDVQVANHGVEALEYIGKADVFFDVILMDMQMPTMDGLTCTREIRAMEKAGKLAGRLPIVAVTANVRQEQIESAMEAGADRVMQKPFKAQELVAMIKELLGGSATIEDT